MCHVPCVICDLRSLMLDVICYMSLLLTIILTASFLAFVHLALPRIGSCPSAPAFSLSTGTRFTALATTDVSIKIDEIDSATPAATGGRQEHQQQLTE